MLTLNFPRWVWLYYILSSSPFGVMCYSPLISMIQTFFLAHVGILLPSGEFVIVKIIYGMVNLSSSNKLKPIIFPEVINSSLYVIIVSSRIGLYIISSSQGIKFSGSKLWINVSGSCWINKYPGVCLYFVDWQRLYSSNHVWWDLYR